MQFSLVPTLFTLHPTAPVEFTVTVFYEFSHYSVIPSPAAHQIAPVKSITVLVALTTTCTHRPELRIRLAEIRWILEVDEILAGWTFHVFADWAKFGFLAVDLHKAGAIESFLQDGTNRPEGAHFSPADLDGTRTRNTVTFADEIDLFPCNLKTNKHIFQSKVLNTA